MLNKSKVKRNIRIVRYYLYKEAIVNIREYFFSFVGSFIGIGTIATLHHFFLPVSDSIFLIGSFGASSVLLYGNPQSPLSQPRNLIGGHVISAIIGVCIYQLFPEMLIVSAPLAVSLSIFFMQVSRTLHPPGGATALIAVIGSSHIKSFGYWYAAFPVLSGALILLTVALVVNNLSSDRSYPVKKK